jgi:transcriptional regulator with XRE-family HTH domain
MEKSQLAKRVRAFRKLKGLTQLDLAERLDLSIGILGAIERGARKPDERLLQKMAEALEISYEELAGPRKEASADA